MSFTNKYDYFSSYFIFYIQGHETLAFVQLINLLIFLYLLFPPLRHTVSAFGLSCSFQIVVINYQLKINILIYFFYALTVRRYNSIKLESKKKKITWDTTPNRIYIHWKR